MSTQLSSDVLCLLDGPSDIELSGTVPDHAGPSTSFSASVGNPSGVKAKPKSKKTTKSSDGVTWQEFASLQDQITSMADAMQILQSTMLASLGNTRPAKKRSTSLRQ